MPSPVGLLDSSALAPPVLPCARPDRQPLLGSEHGRRSGGGPAAAIVSRTSFGKIEGTRRRRRAHGEASVVRLSPRARAAADLSGSPEEPRRLRNTPREHLREDGMRIGRRRLGDSPRKLAREWACARRRHEASPRRRVRASRGGIGSARFPQAPALREVLSDLQRRRPEMEAAWERRGPATQGRASRCATRPSRRRRW